MHWARNVTDSSYYRASYGLEWKLRPLLRCRGSRRYWQPRLRILAFLEVSERWRRDSHKSHDQYWKKKSIHEACETIRRPLLLSCRMCWHKLPLQASPHRKQLPRQSTNQPILQGSNSPKPGNQQFRQFWEPWSSDGKWAYWSIAGSCDRFQYAFISKMIFTDSLTSGINL